VTTESAAPTYLSTPLDLAGRLARLQANIEQVIRGKPDVVALALTCLLAEGHVLIEDVPGVGKTSLARALAASIAGTWQRLQFTPDLLPSDVTGVTIYNQATQRFELHKGPVFANIVLGDEINRASPKTQSALLEVMEERRVTVDGTPHEVPSPFIVIATQNPVDMDGTYALPEAQIDRFLMRLAIGYPDHDAEAQVLADDQAGRRVEDLQAVMTVAEVSELVQAARRMYVADSIYSYIVRIVSRTRELPDVRLGASPRASLALLRAARARTAMQGRDYVTPEDAKQLAAPVLAHRVILTPEAELRGATGADVVGHAVDSVAVPQALG
jgi:MoxR-like ATPase